MKTMVYIFFSFFMFCAMNLNAQSPIEIDTVSLRYVNGFTNQHEIVDEYRMTNHSNEEYITWVSLEPTNDKSNIELVHDFFKKIKGDFSYLTIGHLSLDIRLLKKLHPVRHLPISLSKQIRNQIFIPKGLSL